MWSANPNFAKAHLIYYNYGFDSVKKTYFIKDSVLEQGPLQIKVPRSTRRPECCKESFKS